MSRDNKRFTPAGSGSWFDDERKPFSAFAVSSCGGFGSVSTYAAITSLSTTRISSSKDIRCYDEREALQAKREKQHQVAFIKTQKEKTTTKPVVQLVIPKRSNYCNICAFYKEDEVCPGFEDKNKCWELMTGVDLKF